jgi:hypothetical protein
LQTANASKEDRTWGMISHLAALAGFVIPFGSIVGPLIIYFAKKDQSPFVAFHAKQSMFTQIAACIVALAIALVSLPLMLVCVGFVTIFAAIAVSWGVIIYAIIGGIKVSSGKDFEYWLIGPWVRKSL